MEDREYDIELIKELEAIEAEVAGKLGYEDGDDMAEAADLAWEDWLGQFGN